jgi:magnesium-transporting ATPase (P-type)
MDEASITGESDLIDKINAQDIYLPNPLSKQKTPFIISDSKVMDGSGLLLVLTVGPNTMMNKIRMRLSEEQPPTPLQVKIKLI